MRTGKKMPETVLEVLVEFKKPPRELFGRGNPNAVRFRLGAKDGVDISLLAKKPGTKLVEVLDKDFTKAAMEIGAAAAQALTAAGK